ncbi:MAG: flagellar protein FlaG [Clostridiaceae bacterium]|nr:flagellar protein FlaG [Clostridiaceae bacterium]
MRVSGMDATNTTLAIEVGSGEHVRNVVQTSQRPRVQGTTPHQKHTNSDGEPQLTDEMVGEAVNKANKMLEGTNRRFEYSVHDKINGIMVKVIDENTGEVIREIPPKRILDMVANMMEMAGLLVDERR